MKYYSILLVILFWTTPQSIDTPLSTCTDTPLITGDTAVAPAALPDPTLTVVSLNMAKADRKDRVLRDLRRSSFFGTADVWMLQESTGIVQDIARELGMHYAYAPAQNLDQDTTSGLAIVSRYPISESKRTPLPRYSIVFHSRCRIALSATIHAPNGPVRVINAHLDTRITREQRLRQAAPLFDMEHDGVPTIIGGDFNTANIRWIWSLIPLPGQNHTRAVREFFIERGFDSPLGANKTFKLVGLPLYLDWIFAKHLQSVASGTENIDFSDHNAVWVDLQVNPRR